MYMTRTGVGATDEQRAAAFYLGSLEDPLAPWVQATGPIDPYEMHLPVTVKDPVEWLSFSIVSQQISMAAATAIFSRLLTALGGGFAPERVIAAEDATLLGAGLSHAKVRAIRGLAKQVEDGRLEVGKFRTMPDEEIESELVAVPGIGPWSAEMFMMRCIQRPDVFPAGDAGVRAALTTLDKLSVRITPKAAKQRSQVWRPYRTYATSYLWGYLWALDHPEAYCREVAPVPHVRVPVPRPGRPPLAAEGKRCGAAGHGLSFPAGSPGPADAGQGPLLGAGTLTLPAALTGPAGCQAARTPGQGRTTPRTSGPTGNGPWRTSAPCRPLPRPAARRAERH